MATHEPGDALPLLPLRGRLTIVQWFDEVRRWTELPDDEKARVRDAWVRWYERECR